MELGKVILIGGSFLILIIIIIGVIAFIRINQTVPNNPPSGPPPPIPYCIIPTGTWIENCTGGTISGSTLTAQCRNSNDKFQTTTLDLSKCAPGNISNINGILTCTAGTGFCNSQPACSIPYGSYQNTCASPTINGTVLTTQCTSTNGVIQPYSLDLHNCGQGDVTFNNEMLKCQPGSGLC